ncbi:MAG: hypothetical protein MK198_13735 [Gracilimonas sp.]|uniref:ABC-three component system protein n=1 Tax=Gracilimonas sp. TaxID=1974203 RepID=UPI0037520DD2|nr:hypothetical protein [Gracilimonas sp.]
MSNRNATASWSGYSHQGKVGILVALKKLNKLGLDFDGEYTLDYEQQEDVRILLNGEAIEVHQVKARSSGNTIGTYTNALENFEPCDGGNFLHTIVNVHNWGNLTEEQNPYEVVLFDYGGQLYCDLDEIQEKITNEIRLIFLTIEDDRADNDNYLIQIYEYLLCQIDDLVRKAHNDQTYDPCISLNDLLQIVINNPDEYSSKLFTYRKAFYETFENYIKSIDENDFKIEDDHLEYMIDRIEQIYCLEDQEFEKFLRNINPHTTGGKRISNTNVDEFFNRTNFEIIFLEVLQDVVNEELEINSKQIPKYFKNKSYLLTTINGSDRLINQYAKDILINSEIDFTEFETDFLITERFEGKISDLAPKGKQKDNRKFYVPKEMSFITKDGALDNLNN